MCRRDDARVRRAIMGRCARGGISRVVRVVARVVASSRASRDASTIIAPSPSVSASRGTGEKPERARRRRDDSVREGTGW